MTSRTLSPDLTVTECDDALVVWVASTTVGAERSRLAAELSKVRGVFGVYAEASQPSARRLVDALSILADRPANDPLVPEEPVFGVTAATKLLPRGARVVGWLEAGGYRAVSGTHQPDAAFLVQAQSRLG